MRTTRAVSFVATAALALTGLASVYTGVAPADAGSLDSGFMMKITDDPNNTISGVNYDYLTYPGFDVFMYNNGYNGMFGDEHLSGITFTLNGQRIAGNGDIHLLPAVEQWDAAQPDNSSPLYTPTSACRNPDLRGQSRQYNRTLDTITLPMRYVYDSLTSSVPGEVPSVCNYPQMKYDLIARPEPGGVNLKVVLRDDLPPQLEESAAFMLEFIPSLYKNKSYQVDTDGDGRYDSFGTLPLAPEDPMDEDWPRPDLKYSAWYVEQWNNDKGAQQPRALGRGYSWVLSPEDADTKVSVTSDELLSVFDGRNRSQNGWFGMSSRIPKGSKAGTTVASWHIKASVQPSWTREPSIAHSQAGYGTGTEKIAVVETDKNQRLAAGETATLQRLNADGSYTDVYTAPLGSSRAWTRYNYRDFDFSHINDPGSYAIQYGDVRTEPFPIDDEVYDKTWQHAVSGFMATNMDHMEVREGYKIWHGAAHMDDARMGEHFENTIEAINTDDGTPGGFITWFDGQSVALDRKIPQVVKDKGLTEGSRVTGINKGGWFDAGDFDIEIHSNMSALRNLIIDAQTFDNLDEYDNLSVEWNDDTGGKAEMHRPDGVADIVQQVKHGALVIQALIENVGWANTGVIEVPTLRQYTHLGDGSTDTDGYIYDKTLAADEIVERNGKIYSGKNDDRMVMMWRSAVNPGGGLDNRYVNTSLTNSNQAFDMAGAAAVLKGFDDEFGRKCLDTAKEIWNNEQTTASRANRFNLLVELMLATQAYGDTADYAIYKAALEGILAEATATGGGNPFAPGNILPINTYPTAMLIMDLMDASYSQQISDALVATVNAANSPFAYVAGTPFGFAESLTATWGPSSSKVPNNAAILYKNMAKRGLAGADLAPIRDYIIRGVNYIFGTHPYNDTSWLVGVGANSHKHPYNSNRADEGYIPGSLVPGYINFRPDFPESLDNFSFLWAENEATIGGVSGWIGAAKMADELTRDTSNPGTPAQSVDFTGDYMMTVQETAATDPYTGAAAAPYETLTTPGLDVFMYNTTFSPIFGDQHAAGVEMVVNGQRLATNGDIHLLPTPEQWDATPAPILNNRSSNAATQTVSANLTLPGTEDGTLDPVEYTMNASPEPGGFKLTVDLDRPLPADLAGKAGFNIELIPNVYKEKSYQADTDGDGRYDKFGIVPLMPFDDMETKDRARTQDQKWYVQEWNRDRGDYQPVPLASAKTITLAPETDERIRVTSDSGDVQLLDGRNRAQNGWFVLRTEFGPGSTSLTWHVKVDVDPSWKRAVNIGHSQAGYAPVQTKQAVMELDPAAQAPASAAVKRINSDGTYTTVYTGKVGPAKRWLRYDYRTFDFSSVKTPGIYVIDYAGETTEVFPIDEKVYSKSWQQALSGFLAKEMDHIWVREMYKIAHAASHMDDAIMWPLCGEPFRDEASFDGSWFDGQDYCPTSRTNTDYDSLEHIPGLAVGGWYDAGDYDLEATRQAGVIQDLAMAYREFQPTYDTMDVDWAEDTGGYVELHRADGVPDIVQQVRHGVLNVIARFDAIGYNFKVVEVPTLRQYTHLGDGYTETDNRIYDPSLDEDEVVGLRSGKQDDRLAMVGEKEAGLQFYGAYAMAAAATVLRGYDDELADKALTYAERVWDTEEIVTEVDPSACEPTDFMCYFSLVGQMAAEFNTAVELTLATNGAPRYVAAVKELFEVVKAPMGFGASFASGGWKAALVLDYMDDEFKAEFKEAAIAYKEAYDASTAANPFGVSDTVGMWGGSTDVVDMGIVMYYMHDLYPDIFSSDYTLRAGTYILGTHPDNSVSWLSGVGTQSVEHAYGNTRAEDTYVAGGIVPGYVPIMPDLPEAQSEFGMMWFESEYVIDTSAKWVFVGNAIDRLANEEPAAVQPPDQTKTTLANQVADVDAKVTAGTYSAGAVTPSSWSAFTKALADAKAVEAKANPSAAEVAATQAALTAAIAGLTPRGDVSQLQAMVDAAAALAASPALSATTKVAIAAALTAGRATVAKGAEASQSDVSAALAALSGAIGAAQFDKTTASANDDAAARDSLTALIGGLSAVPPGAYADASYAAFRDALNSASAVLADPNATSEQLRSELIRLSAAMAALSTQVQPPGTTPAPPATKVIKAGTVKIRGTAKVGKKLTAAVTKWTKGTQYSYQWYSGSKKIKNATNKTFTIPKSLKGKKIRVKVTGTINGYVSKAKNSTATKKIK